ncbi:membrane-spanning 4-domains subfamily A member 15-like isoform X3 [Neopelma chrysocephalum]|uniref:membrane-spanning 4-domains subfamily A member 15-like isoform X3 n=1 Tax=Neopelma chrysocephalum TaxID=114329 RepID=UPI000FCD24CB|nr:membrane-spanning 4-domains subfamily A member 15-like isoform X3 [Neopelma chrysocephalum]
MEHLPQPLAARMFHFPPPPSFLRGDFLGGGLGLGGARGVCDAAADVTAPGQWAAGGAGCGGRGVAGAAPGGAGLLRGVPAPPDLSMQGMGSLRLGNRAVMYTAETLSKGKNRVMGTIQIMTGFLHIGFGIVLTTLTNLYTSVFVIGEIPFLGGVSFIISGCLSIGAEKSPTECAVKGSQTMNVISAIFALLGIVAFIVDLNFNVLYHSTLDYHGYLVLVGPWGDDSPFGSIREPEKRRDGGLGALTEPGVRRERRGEPQSAAWGGIPPPGQVHPGRC